MLELKNICYVIDGKKILDDINLKIDLNKIIIITGPNGSGKSTLSKIIMGIIKPTSGKVYFNGEDITNLSVDKRAKLGMSYAFQQPVRFKGITIEDIINLSTKKKNGFAEIANILESVGLDYREYLNREVDDKLSGGEIKRIEIASVISNNSKLIILDEPEAGIDLWSFNDLINLFVGKKNNSKSSLIIISHQQRLFKIADEIILLEKGKIKCHQSYDELKNVLCCNSNCCGRGHIHE